jgi:hypothetical protein
MSELNMVFDAVDLEAGAWPVEPPVCRPEEDKYRMHVESLNSIAKRKPACYT